MKTDLQKGFTLVEIAIVLVIVGLLLAAVLKGQELITQGKIKGVINDFNGVMTAYNGYQDRYKAIPGDDPGAAARWTSAGITTLSTFGNGVVNGNYFDDQLNSSEADYFWLELRLANFYAGSTSNVTGGDVSGLKLPTNSVGGEIGVQNGALGIPGLVVCSTNVPYKIALAVDTQLDDAKAPTGTVRGILYDTTTAVGSGNPVIGVAPTADYVDGNTYVLCRSAS